MNDRLVSSINFATEEALPMGEKARLQHPWHGDIILKELYDLKDQQFAQNVNSNELS